MGTLEFIGVLLAIYLIVRFIYKRTPRYKAKMERKAERSATRYRRSRLIGARGYDPAASATCGHPRCNGHAGRCREMTRRAETATEFHRPRKKD